MQLDTLYIVAIVTCLFNVGYSFISLGAVKSEGLFQPYLYFFNINLLERIHITKTYETLILCQSKSLGLVLHLMKLLEQHKGSISGSRGELGGSLEPLPAPVFKYPMKI